MDDARFLYLFSSLATSIWPSGVFDSSSSLTFLYLKLELQSWGCVATMTGDGRSRCEDFCRRWSCTYSHRSSSPESELSVFFALGRLFDMSRRGLRVSAACAGSIPEHGQPGPMAQPGLTQKWPCPIMYFGPTGRAWAAKYWPDSDSGRAWAEILQVLAKAWPDGPTARWNSAQLGRA
jgi:hypothetical protein